MCFDAACQAAQDRAFVAVVLLPLVGLAVSIARWALAKPGEAASTFVDPDTGVVFEAGPGEEGPETDAAGRLAYQAVSYTPTPVPVGAPGDRIRISVGPVGRRSARTYVFKRLLTARPSKILGVSLPRPLGITWAEDEAGRVVVGGFTEGGEAGRRAAAAALDPVHLAATALAPGDVLRALTATTVVFRGAGALAGWAPGVREVVLFGADGAKWPTVRAALRKGDAADGDVTIIVEREEGGRGGGGSSASGGSVGRAAAAAVADLSEELNPDR
jgi:hypothetical protein